MKKISLVVFIAMIANATIYAQSLYNIKKGEVAFFSKTPVEDISAKNSKPISILNTATNDIVVQLQIIQFKFPNSLMEEHFNENYMETTKFPKASFSGKINEKVDFTKDGEYEVTSTGKLTIHGVVKDRTIKGKLSIKKGEISLKSDFDVALVDHNIEVPTVVFAKIAEVIKVSLDFQYQLKK